MRKTNKLTILLFFVTILLILGINSKVKATTDTSTDSTTGATTDTTTVTNLSTVSNFEDFETKIDNETIIPSFSNDIEKGKENWSCQFDFTIDRPSYVLIRNVAKADNPNDYVDFEVSINSTNLTKKYDSKKVSNKSITNADFRIYLEKGTYTILFTDYYTAPYNCKPQTLNTYLGILPQNTEILSAQYIGDSASGKTVKLKINSLDKVNKLYIDSLSYSSTSVSTQYSLDTNNCATIDIEEGWYKGAYPYIAIKVVDIFGFTSIMNYKILNNFTATISGIADKTYTGLPIKQTNYAVKNYYTDLTYSVSYENNINVGTATITFTGAKDTLGIVSKTFKIKPMNISAFKISLATTSYSYNGKVKKPTVKVTNKKNQTISKNNYTISYAKGRKNVGKYKVLVKFKSNNYTGTKTLYFTIKPKTTKISSLKRDKKNKVIVKWKKQSAQVNGYQLQYSTNRKLKNPKTITINKNSITSKTISNLSRKKTYYFRIRTFKKVGNVKYYSDWK